MWGIEPGRLISKPKFLIIPLISSRHQFLAVSFWSHSLLSLVKPTEDGHFERGETPQGQHKAMARMEEGVLPGDPEGQQREGSSPACYKQTDSSAPSPLTLYKK